MSSIFNDLKERNIMDKKTNEEIIEILDNIIYWDSCPIAYKEKIPRLIDALKQVKNIAYEPVLGTGLTTKDINGIEFGVGSTVSFNTYTPDKMTTIRKVIIRNNELWAGEIPIVMLAGERRNLQVIT